MGANLTVMPAAAAGIIMPPARLCRNVVLVVTKTFLENLPVLGEMGTLHS